MRKSIKMLIFTLMVAVLIEGLVAVLALLQLVQLIHEPQARGMQQARNMSTEQVDNTYYAGN